MADAAAFSTLCEELEQQTSLDRLEARGTVRIALKQSGLDVGSVTPSQMAVVIDKILPGELESRGVDGAAGVCQALKAKVQALPEEGGHDTPEAVFSRLAAS